MIKQTTDYDMFKFRHDNRAKIDTTHVERLKRSIAARNLLNLRPIDVNGDMEVIDGQHRLIAAKALQVPIYYKIDSSLGSSDIILMNTSKSWSVMDYLNFYCKNHYPEYLKLKAFMDGNGITIRVALNIHNGESKIKREEFKAGKFIYNEISCGSQIEICWEIISYIKRINGYSDYTKSSRFWAALLKLINHGEFNLERWRANLPKMVERFRAKACVEDYLKLLMDVHNYRNHEKIDLLEKRYN
jgi:ParB-like nuclease domain